MDCYRVRPEQIASISRYSCDVSEIITPDFTVVFFRELEKVNAQSLACCSESEVYTDQR